MFNEDEVRRRVFQIAQATNLDNLSEHEIIDVQTIAQDIVDLCDEELEQRVSPPISLISKPHSCEAKSDPKASDSTYSVPTDVQGVLDEFEWLGVMRKTRPNLRQISVESVTSSDEPTMRKSRFSEEQIIGIRGAGSGPATGTSAASTGSAGRRSTSGSRSSAAWTSRYRRRNSPT